MLLTIGCRRSLDILAMDSIISVFAIVTFVTVIIVTMTVVVMKEKPARKDAACTVDDYFRTLASYISHNGLTSFNDELPGKCQGNQPKAEEISKFQKSLTEAIHSCNKIKEDIRKSIPQPILTLFTSVNPDPLFAEVNKRTIENWSSLLPYVNLVMFTNDSRISGLCRERGWSVFPVTKTGLGGIPVLKAMFQHVIKTFRTPYFGFANGDIIFTDSLLESLLKMKNIFSQADNIMLTGRRINVPGLRLKELVSYKHIEKVARERGTIFVISSEDYFITSNKFRWQDIPEFVIGRPAYDNWIVAHARCNGVKVVDTTNTILAVHQTTKRGDTTGHAHSTANYNDELLFTLQQPRDYQKGFITCPEWYSYHTLCGDVDVVRRQNIPASCAC